MPCMDSPTRSQVCTAAVVPEDGPISSTTEPRARRHDQYGSRGLGCASQRDVDVGGSPELPECGVAPWPAHSTGMCRHHDRRTELPERGHSQKGSSVPVDHQARGQSRARPPHRRSGLDDVTRFTFNNAHQDPSFVRQCLSFEFFAAAGIAAPRLQFAHLSVNGSDLGVVNVETIEPFLARNFPSAAGKLWEAPSATSGQARGRNLRAGDGRGRRPHGARAGDHRCRHCPARRCSTAQALRESISSSATGPEAVVSHLDGYHVNGNNFFAYVDPVARVQFFLGRGPGFLAADGDDLSGAHGARPQALQHSRDPGAVPRAVRICSILGSRCLREISRMRASSPRCSYSQECRTCCIRWSRRRRESAAGSVSATRWCARSSRVRRRS